MTLRLNGATSGSVSLDAPATGSNVTLELPTDSIKPGMVLVAAQSFSAVSSVSVNNCFTATYENYKVVVAVTGTVAATTPFWLRFRASGTDNSSSLYSYGGRMNVTNLTQDLLTTSTNATYLGPLGDTRVGVSFDVTTPNQPLRTNYMALSSGWGTTQGGSAFVTGVFFADTIFDGFTVYPGSGTVTGSLRIYGFRNSL